MLVQLCSVVPQIWQFDPIAEEKCNLCFREAAVTLLKSEGFTELGREGLQKCQSCS